MRLARAWLLTTALVALGAPDGIAAQSHKPPPVQSTKHASAPSSKASRAEHHKGGSAPALKREEAARHGERKSASKQIPMPKERPAAADAPPLPRDLAATKQAIDLARHSKLAEATALAASITDQVARKLVEWALLCRSDSEVGFERYAAFIRANPDWPSLPLRRRAEAQLWQNARDAATMRGFVGAEPISAAGHLARARALMAEGDNSGAEHEVRAVWRTAGLSGESEAAVLAAFPGVLTRADHVARMDRLIGAKNFDAAMRAAKRVGDDHVAIVKACAAAETKSPKGGAPLDGVPVGAREDLGYALCRLHLLLRNDTPGSNARGRIETPEADIEAAVKLALAASPEDMASQDTDEWWRERRALARKLIDLGDTQTAYNVVRAAAPPANPYYRAEFHFMAGWIALRFLADPATAFGHFAHIDEGAADPVVLARAAYWRGRAAEAAGRLDEMRAQYETAARFPTAYYGQLARARLAFGEIVLLRPPPESVPNEATELVHAADILYAIGERDLVASFVAGRGADAGYPGSRPRHRKAVRSTAAPTS
jgi:soluble lytic murein transglycosylase